jgi:DNA modification methylase
MNSLTAVIQKPEQLFSITEQKNILIMDNIDSQIRIEKINDLDMNLYRYFAQTFLQDNNLTRQLVSFQANKKRKKYRWYKFKEGFSASLIEYLLSKYNIKNGKLLDPFAGSGTALFTAMENGLNAEGIELLPIGQYLIKARNILDKDFSKDDLNVLKQWKIFRPWKKSKDKIPVTHLNITKGAYSPETLDSIEKYLATIAKEKKNILFILKFVLLCVLESVSFTRKDGQYLRWDYRSGRQQGKKQFDKGIILDFETAIEHKLSEIIEDLENADSKLFNIMQKNCDLTKLYEGSCLNILPKLSSNTYDVVFTSPPYCNRYDYTRTYALELVMLNTNQESMNNLRQTMLSCTVENRNKNLLKINSHWSNVINVVDNQMLLQEILSYLEFERQNKRLNNNGISRMVRGYFYEMSCVISECARVLKKNGYLFMVNDNVRYAGVSISVDMILSDIANRLGFSIENILVLPSKKGNSSQQMGKHGRATLRKCVYVWRKR